MAAPSTAATAPDAASALAAPVTKSHDEVIARIIRANGADPEDMTSNLRSREEEVFTDYGAIPAPYPPELLVRTFERSSALRPCVDALVTNVHGFGHRLVPTIDLKDVKADQLIGEAILSERLHESEDDATYPTPEEIAERRGEIERGMQLERLRLNVFFKNCSREGFVELRKQVWTDYEVAGNGFIEVLRSRNQRIAQLNYAPTTNVRLRRLGEFVNVAQRIRISEIAYADVERWERFRSYVQVVNGVFTYFKEFGDPRPMSSRSGRYYEQLDDLPPGERPATELLHFRVFSSRSSYGIPRWVGATFEVLGIRAAAEVNYTHFDSKGVPPLAVLVSGGTLNAGAGEMIAQFIETKIKGRQNFHSVLVLEALPMAGSDPAAAGRVRIALQPLAQQQDGIFLEYAEQSEDVVARQFRLSPITRGKTKDYNRATADAALRKDEQQVFQPERQGFDERFERTVLTDMGIRYWKMVSNSPTASDPEILAKIVDTFVRNNTLTPEEARRFVASILNTELAEIPASWLKQPSAFTLAGIPVEELPVDDALATPEENQLAGFPKLFQQIIGLRNALRGRTGATTERASKALETNVLPGVETIYVNQETMDSWVAPPRSAAAAGAAADDEGA